ncbi:hypothetical protein DXG01_005311 [Tephrocybe rancida]|nr:hypothetical protein DXG01_005311 [Tephrocybe rancida]
MFSSEAPSALAADEVNPTATGSVSERFSAPDADIVFQSSDGIQFRIHKANLDACTEGFSPPEHSTLDEVAHLTEQSHVLELLFQFIYPESQPELETFDFDILSALAEAAEKYRVYPAMNLCTLHLAKHLREHCEEIFQHGLKHRIRKLVDPAAPLLLNHPEEFFLKLDNSYLLPWVSPSYLAVSFLGMTLTSIPDALPHAMQSSLDQLLNVATLHNLDEAFRLPQENPPVKFCKKDYFMKALRQSLETDMGLLPTLSDIAFPEDKECPEWLAEELSAEPSATLYLENLDASSLTQLYEAAKDYKVFTAVTLCEQRLKLLKTLREHPSAAFWYALEIRDFELVDNAAPFLIGKLSLIEAFHSMDLMIGLKWASP